jgi:hypothetical protein
VLYRGRERDSVHTGLLFYIGGVRETVYIQGYCVI